MVRVVAEDGQLVPGSGRPGRGAWVCRDSACCLDLAEKRRAWDRALRTAIAPGASARLGVLLGVGEPAGEGSVAVCEDGMPGRSVGLARVGAKGS